MGLTRRVLISVLVVSSLSGCASRFAQRCEDPLRYTGSGQIPPIRIPDDLTPPDQTESLQIPAPIEGEVEELESRGSCLESPPDYYETGAPG
jgi:uncharacterized lipoprotein